MITKLTKKQEELIPAYIQKWVNQASKPMDENKASEYTKQLYERMGEGEPIIIFGDSPFSTAILAALFWNLVSNLELKKIKKSQLWSQLDSQLHSQLHSQLGSQLYNQLGSQLDSQLYNQLGSQLRSQLYNQLHSQLDSQLWSQLDSQLYNQLGSQLRSQLGSQLRTINSGWYVNIYWLAWCGWYEYGKMIGVKFDKDIYEMFINFNSEVNFIIPYEGIAFISRKPEVIAWKGALLHGDKGPAVRYKDGYSLWMLNGVRVEEKHVMTPAEKIDVKAMILNEKNVEIRREMIRKVGIERFIQAIGAKVMDSKGNYELLSLPLSEEVPDARYLKMLNPSIGVWHVEGVEGNTIQEALDFRARNVLKTNQNWNPIQLT